MKAVKLRPHSGSLCGEVKNVRSSISCDHRVVALLHSPLRSPLRPLRGRNNPHHSIEHQTRRPVQPRKPWERTRHRKLQQPSLAAQIEKPSCRLVALTKKPVRQADRPPALRHNFLQHALFE